MSRTLKPVAAGVHHIALRGVNAFLFEIAGGLLLAGTGTQRDAGGIGRAVRDLGRTPRELRGADPRGRRGALSPALGSGRRGCRGTGASRTGRGLEGRLGSRGDRSFGCQALRCAATKSSISPSRSQMRSGGSHVAVIELPASATMSS